MSLLTLQLFDSKCKVFTTKHEEFSNHLRNLYNGVQLNFNSEQALLKLRSDDIYQFMNLISETLDNADCVQEIIISLVLLRESIK